MKTRNILIVGGDKRQKYLKEYLLSKAYNVESYGLFDWDDTEDKLKSLIKKDSVIILPLPVSRNNKTINMPFSKKEVSIERLVNLLSPDNFVLGGMIKGKLLNFLTENKIPFKDFYDDEFIKENAILTSYGLLKIVLEHIDFALPVGKYAILGYGRVAKECADILNKNSANVTIFARNLFQRQEAILRGNKSHHLNEFSSLANNFQIIINTIPVNIIDEETLKNINKECKIIELASAPYGVDFEKARKYSVNVIKAPGLPGKYTPKTAGELIGKFAEEFLQREDSV